MTVRVELEGIDGARVVRRAEGEASDAGASAAMTVRTGVEGPALRVEPLGAGWFRVLDADGSVLDTVRALVDDDGDEVFVAWTGGEATLEIASVGGRARPAAARRAAAAGRSGPGHHGGGPGEVRAPMPGAIVKVDVEEGAAVAEGDRVLVLEAMKMEHEMRAPRGGTVSKVHVAAGDRVDGDALLVEIAEDAPPG